MARTPRPQRDLERMRSAVQAAGGDAAPAMTVALAQIGAAFDEAAVVNGFKLRVERTIRLGAASPRGAAPASAPAPRCCPAAASTPRSSLSSAGGATSARRFRSRARSAAATGFRSKFCASFASFCG